MEIDPEALEETLTRLRGETSRPDAVDLTTSFDQVAKAANALLSSSGVAVMVVDDTQVLRSVAATDEPGRSFEHHQAEAGEGPCVDALVYNRTVATADVQGDGRWPKLADRMAGEPVHAVLGSPLLVHGLAVGTLNAYDDRARDWGQSEVDALHAFIEVADTLLINALAAHRSGQVVGQLEHALEHRVQIERAVGVIMATRSTGAVGAFDLLRVAARRQRRKASEVAEEVLRSGPSVLDRTT